MESSLTIVTPGAARDRTIELDADEVRIGRSSRSDIRIPTRSVSGHHLTLRRAEDGWTLTDEHSTNGTRLNGQVLTPGQPEPLSGGDVIELTDVRLEFDVARGTTLDVLSLQETGTLARQLASDLLLDASDEDLARFEVEMPGGATVQPLEDSLARAFIGSDEDCLVTLDRLDAPRLLEVSRVEDGFGIRPTDVTGRDALTLNGAPLTSKAPLSDGDVIEAGPYRLRFYDPLESVLLDLEDPPAHRADDKLAADSEAPSAPSPSTDVSPEATASTAAQSGLTLTEWTILIIAIVLMLGAAGLLLIVFGVV